MKRILNDSREKEILFREGEKRYKTIIFTLANGSKVLSSQCNKAVKYMFSFKLRFKWFAGKNSRSRYFYYVFAINQSLV